MTQNQQQTEDLLVAHVVNVERALGVLTERVNVAESVIKHQRIFGVILAVMFVLGCGVFFNQQRLAWEAVRDRCADANEHRTGSRVLWSNVLANTPVVVPRPGATAEEAADVERRNQVRKNFERDLTIYFDPINC